MLNIKENLTYSILTGLIYYVLDKYLDCGLLGIIVAPTIIEILYNSKE